MGADAPVWRDEPPVGKRSYFFPRKHIATVRGEQVVFRSIMKMGTYELWDEAVLACSRELDWFTRRSHSSEMLLDGYAMSWMQDTL